jgi:DNA-cytosine methyltransferase
VITAREAARLQSFPDDFVFKGSKGSLCVQIGNAVPPLLAFSVAKQIKAKMKAKNVIDLFAGAGGLSKGFEWAGFNIVAANDNFKEACETYKLNHPQTKLVQGDITQSETKKALYKAIGKTKIDIVAGGPPCQGFSHAGKRFIDDPRNFLFKEFVAVAKKVNPPIILLENVEGILTINGGKTFEGIKESFEKLGYKLAGHKVRAVEYGVPQKRKRMILIGVKMGNPEDLFPEALIKEESSYITVKDAISNLADIGAGENLINVTLKPQTSYQRLMAGLISPEEFLAKHLRRA